MTHDSNYLEHIGLVTDTQQGRVKIALVGSGCSACHNSLCMLGDSKAKEVEVLTNESLFQSGDEVVVKINPASGYRAVLLLYVSPFLVVLLTLVFMMQSGYPEGLSGVASLFILVPYFGILYLLRKKLGSHCKIEVVKI
jgi:sigma-E factor negative regulatory protein RseC